jgi:type I restriction enzyme, R subunit
MTIKVTEKQFEDLIEKYLLDSGYVKGTNNYDVKLAIDYEILIQFIQKSQKEKWKKLREIYAEFTRDEILRSLEKALEKESMIYVLRNGFTISDIKIDCAYFKPVSRLNPDLKWLYDQNILSVIRQLYYSSKNENSIDLVFFLNGLPVATVELKDYNQGYLDAIAQYKQDREQNEILFQFKKRAIVHFAVDPFEIHMTTKINGNDSEFLPFNKGDNFGKGNPENPNGLRTSYLWENILQKDQWLDIIGNYITLQIISQKYPLPAKETLIFPRYHQLDAVNLLQKETKTLGSGNNFLVQHSTGSGKSNTIAWLAYKLFSLHDTNDSPIFDSIIVLSDRIGIVNQLSKTIEQFEQTSGVVKRMETTKMLTDNLESAKAILVTTQQKFPPALKKIGEIKGKKFAVIIDEAHSSQTGDEAKAVVDVLSAKMPEEVKKEATQEESKKDIVDQIEELRSIENLSYYAFTATPKEKTLRLFGKEISEASHRGDGIPYDPHHEYTMRQAIEEGFILDVLQNYTTYNQLFHLVKTSTDEKIVEGKRATAAILRWVNSHEEAVEEKSEVILEDFLQNVKPAIGGLAKAMLTTSARLAAFKYHRAINKIIKEKNIQGVKTLIAFSGSIKDEEGNVHTERSLNHTSTDEELRELFDTPEYNILIVAEKYQTGFDQPLLHTMYVDKQLQGIKAVQTLSRLNRYHPLKEETRVIDFQNDVGKIEKSFAKFYEGTSLIDKVKPEFLVKLYSHIMDDFKIITLNDLEEFASIFFKPESEQLDSDHVDIFRKMEPILKRYSETEEKVQDEFRANLSKYHKEYSFLTRLIQYSDKNMGILYALIKFLFVKKLLLGYSIQFGDPQGEVSLQRFRLEKTHEGSISLDSGKKRLTATEKIPDGKEPEKLTSLSLVIQTMNEVHGIGLNLTDAEKITINGWMEVLKKIPTLKDIAQSPHNDSSAVTGEFKKEFDKIIIKKESREKHKGLVSKIWENEQFHQDIVKVGAEVYYDWAITPENHIENRLRFRQTITSCKGYIHWVDRYFNYEGLEFLVNALNIQEVKHVKILTSVYQNGINDKLYNEFVKFQNELKSKDITCEMQVIMTKDLHRVMHDRYIIAENITYNVPSPTTVNLGQFSEIKKSTAAIPFDDWWNSLESIDIIENWDKIKLKREQLSQRY